MPFNSAVGPTWVVPRLFALCGKQYVLQRKWFMEQLVSMNLFIHVIPSCLCSASTTITITVQSFKELYCEHHSQDRCVWMTVLRVVGGNSQRCVAVTFSHIWVQKCHVKCKHSSILVRSFKHHNLGVHRRLDMAVDQHVLKRKMAPLIRPGLICMRACVSIITGFKKSPHKHHFYMQV